MAGKLVECVPNFSEGRDPATLAALRAALDLADVAAGRLDAFWELWLSPWDVAAGVVLIREAGGVVTRPDGSANVLGSGPIVAGNATLQPWLLNLLRD